MHIYNHLKDPLVQQAHPVLIDLLEEEEVAPNLNKNSSIPEPRSEKELDNAVSQQASKYLHFQDFGVFDFDMDDLYLEEIPTIIDITEEEEEVVTLPKLNLQNNSSIPNVSTTTNNIDLPQILNDIFFQEKELNAGSNNIEIEVSPKKAQGNTPSMNDCSVSESPSLDDISITLPDDQKPEEKIQTPSETNMNEVESSSSKASLKRKKGKQKVKKNQILKDDHIIPSLPDAFKNPFAFGSEGMLNVVREIIEEAKKTGKKSRAFPRAPKDANVYGWNDYVKGVRDSGMPNTYALCKISQQLGHGVFLRTDAPAMSAKQFVAIYSGEYKFISYKQISKNDKDIDNTYAFEVIPEITLNKKQIDMLEFGEKCTVKDKFALRIEAAQSGNFARYINHSSKNANVAPYVFEKDNKLEIYFITIKKILPGQELLIDYGQDYWETKDIKPLEVDPNTHRLVGSNLLPGNKGQQPRQKRAKTTIEESPQTVLEKELEKPKAPTHQKKRKTSKKTSPFNSKETQTSAYNPFMVSESNNSSKQPNIGTKKTSKRIKKKKNTSNKKEASIFSDSEDDFKQQKVARKKTAQITLEDKRQFLAEHCLTFSLDDKLQFEAYEEFILKSNEIKNPDKALYQSLKQYEIEMTKFSIPSCLTLEALPDTGELAVFTKHDSKAIPPDTLIGVYSGFYRVKEFDKGWSETAFDLSFFEKEGKEYVLQVEAEEDCNFTAKIKHSTRSNVHSEIYKMKNNKLEILIFSSEMIEPGSALLLDYGEHFLANTKQTIQDIDPQKYFLNETGTVSLHKTTEQ